MEGHAARSPFTMPLHWQPGIWWRTLYTIWICLVYTQYTRAEQWERRELLRYSAAQIKTLASARDPGEAFDLTNTNSHLAKILIPRARTFLILYSNAQIKYRKRFSWI